MRLAIASPACRCHVERRKSSLFRLWRDGSAMHVLVISIGSLGDTVPFLAIGKALVARGHRVTLVGNAHYREMIEQAGLGFVENLTEEDYNDFLMGQAEWTGLRALKEMGELVKEQVEKIY